MALAEPLICDAAFSPESLNVCETDSSSRRPANEQEDGQLDRGGQQTEAAVCGTDQAKA